MTFIHTPHLNCDDQKMFPNIAKYFLKRKTAPSWEPLGLSKLLQQC